MGNADSARAHTIFSQVIDRPARKLIIKRGKKAADYFAFCEEVGCEVWGILCSVKGAIHEPVGLWLPDQLRPADTSKYVQGVEVPADYDGPVPDDMEVVDLAPCKMMVFHGPPFADEDFGDAIDEVWAAIDAYKPEVYGWEWADTEAPRYQLEPRGERGYIEARPVRALR